MQAIDEDGYREFDTSYKSLVKRIDADLKNVLPEKEPVNLYNPMQYMLELPGKRFRAVLLLLSCKSFCGEFERSMQAACALEIIHNFTLVHDDIMDDDDVRRGQPTVYKKWDENVAILTGDGLIALAYKLLSGVPAEKIRQVIKIFSEGIIKICEGQSYDSDFEKRINISGEEYLRMISLKTGVLISISAEIGALLGDAGSEEVKKVKNFGMELGNAFQIQDDLFDIYSSEDVLGKNIGSDLRKGKKSYPVILFMEKAREEDKKLYYNSVNRTTLSAEYLPVIKDLFSKYDIERTVQKEVNNRIDDAQRVLRTIQNRTHIRDLFFLAEKIRRRKY